MWKKLGTIVIVAVAISIFAVIPVFSDTSSAEKIVSEGPYKIKLLNEKGEDLTDPVFGNTTFHFDTYTENGYVRFILKAVVTIEIIPATLLIISESGMFGVKVSVSGLEDTYLDEAGLRMNLEADDTAYHADLLSSNKFESAFSNNSGDMGSFSPNVQYLLSMSTIYGVIEEKTPEDISNITITFEAIMDAGYHQVLFISEGETVDSYILPDNATITEVPSVSRSGYSFQGWFTPDGKEITEGYVISPDEGDIIATAKWEADGSGGPNIIPITIGGVSLLLLATSFIIFFIKRRKEDEPPQ